MERIISRRITLKLFSFLQLVHARLPHLRRHRWHRRRGRRPISSFRTLIKKHNYHVREKLLTPQKQSEKRTPLSKSSGHEPCSSSLLSSGSLCCGPSSLCIHNFGSIQAERSPLNFDSREGFWSSARVYVEALIIELKKGKIKDPVPILLSLCRFHPFS